MEKFLAAIEGAPLGRLLPVIPILLAFYFLPSIIYLVRIRPHRARFLLINLLTGWTFAVWAGLILWALTGRSGKLDRQDPQA